MTGTSRSESLVVMAAVVGTVVTGLLTSPLAHADPLDAIRGAVNGSRAQSTCSALTYNLDLEAAAQQLARSGDAYLHVYPHGYQGNTQANLVSNDPTDKATEELVAQEVGPIHDCSYKDFGVGMFRNEGTDESIVTVVLGRPAAPPAPAPGPTYAPQAPQTAHVVGGDLPVFNIAHDDTKDPATGVQGMKIATLPNATVITFDGVCKSGWCRIKSPLIPTGFGFGEERFLELD
jgi:hypothetical protein